MKIRIRVARKSQEKPQRLSLPAKYVTTAVIHSLKHHLAWGLSDARY